ncbi:MAG: hypothetical protein V4658_00720 [Bacteroidota bacterium]
MLTLWKYVFAHANASLIITVQRMAIPAILRSVFTRNKVLVVFHHYDSREKLSLFYHLNAWVLFKLLSAAPSTVRVVVVADFWISFLLAKGVPASVIIHVPNLFDTGKYQADKSILKNDKQVYFGQYSAKQHASVFELITRLSAQGYECFFTTPYGNETGTEKNVNVMHLKFDEYLEKMASSSYTVCLGAFNEGWNRVAHESLLCNTSVIGNASGGLADLLNQSGQFLVADSNEAYDVITRNRKKEINAEFLKRYDLSQISYHAKPIIDFCIS